MFSFLRDLRYGARTLRNSPGLVVVAVLALTLGIGLTTTMFSIVYGALMRGLPFPDGDRIGIIARADPARQIQRQSLPIHDYVDIKTAQHSFDDLAAYYNGTVNVSGTEKAERFDGAFVTANLFRVLRVQPILGRVFRDGEDVANGEHLAVIGSVMWRNRYAGNPHILGKSIRVNGQPFTVIGVMPDGFLFPEREEIWLPLAMDPLAIKRGDGQRLDVVGRLKHGVSWDQANVELAAISKRLGQEYVETNKGFTASVAPFAEGEIGRDAQGLLWTMLGAVFFVLLIACANVANLLLDRAAHRTREVGIRTALGASRWAVVRQFLAESLVLASVGAALGVVVAYFGIALFNRSLVDAQPPFWVDIALHPPVLIFAMSLGVLSSLVAGVIPAVQSSRSDIAEILKDESRGASGLRVGKLSRGLVMFEVALSCGLLVAAGLTIKSVTKLRHIDYGFTTASVFTARIGFPAGYTDTAKQMRFYEQLEPKLAAIPGARAAAISSGIPGLNMGGSEIAIDGKTYQTDHDYPHTRTLSVTPSYFETVELPVTEGRGFTVEDRTESPYVAIVNHKFVHELLGDQSPIGRRIRLHGGSSTEPWRTIVGVVPDTWTGDTEKPREPVVYLPIAQAHSNFVSLLVRMPSNPMAITPLVREAVASLDADIPLYWVRTMIESLERPTWFVRVFGTIFMIFGFVALFLASVGLYAVMSFSVSRRARELGIRIALGAQGRDIVRLVVGQGVIQLAVGLTFGLALAAALSKLLGIILFEVQPRDPLVFGSVVAVLAGSGLLACFVPARRASRVDPNNALRAEG